MRSLRLTFLALLSIALASAASAQDQLNGDAIRAKIVGNTITIVTQNLELATGLVQPDGTIRGHIGGDNFTGRWSIQNNNELCFDLPDNTFDICRRVVSAGKHINLFATTGGLRGRAEILQGNPYGL